MVAEQVSEPGPVLSPWSQIIPPIIMSQQEGFAQPAQDEDAMARFAVLEKQVWEYVTPQLHNLMHNAGAEGVFAQSLVQLKAEMDAMSQEMKELKKNDKAIKF